MCPVFIRVSVSSAKVEKVVKPPHKPVFIKSTVFGESELFLTARAAIRPITKHPRRFITRVFTGKANGSLSGIRPIRYLRQAPIPPPKATIKQFNISFLNIIKLILNLQRRYRLIQEYYILAKLQYFCQYVVLIFYLHTHKKSYSRALAISLIVYKYFIIIYQLISVLYYLIISTFTYYKPKNRILYNQNTMVK